MKRKEKTYSYQKCIAYVIWIRKMKIAAFVTLFCQKKFINKLKSTQYFLCNTNMQNVDTYMIMNIRIVILQNCKNE